PSFTRTATWSGCGQRTARSTSSSSEAVPWTTQHRGPARKAKPAPRRNRSPALPEHVDAAAVLRLPPVRGVIAPAIRPASVDVRHPVRVGEPAGADDRACPSLGVYGGGQRGNASGHVGGRLGDREAGALAAGVPPV